jgi:hypothetical protein
MTHILETGINARVQGSAFEPHDAAVAGIVAGTLDGVGG